MIIISCRLWSLLVVAAPLFLLLVQTLTTTVNGLSISPPPESSSRREWVKQQVLAFGATVTVTPWASASAAESSNELPLVLRDFTKLAPLGNKYESHSSRDGKTLHLPLQELASRLAEDLTAGHTGHGGYLISGDLDESIYRDDCVFVDPTNRVSSLSQYRNALRILFDPTESQVRLVKPIRVNNQKREIEAKIRSRGVLQLPWRPYITAYESNIVYSIDEDGLISQQSQTWSKAASKALQESFTPSIFRSAPSSTLRPRRDESTEVAQLFDYVNGRRPYEYTQEERFEISDLIDRIVQLASNSNFRSNLLPGKWMLVYLQPGPTGEGIDRRIPFPEFDFNDNFQVFSRASLVNIGEVIGPLLQVRVKGDLQEDSPGNFSAPKRLVAEIKSGEICWKGTNCFGLPISGEGIFDSVYLGERLRIGQNINGGGARVVQVKLE
jgi:hypothetical protein